MIKSMKVLNFGSLNLDYVYQVPHIVHPGETLSSSRLDVHCGGKGLNQSLALRRAGIEVWHAGMIGNDGEMLKQLCTKEGIHTDFLNVADAKTGHAIIQVDQEGQNSIVLFPGTNRQITKEFVDDVLNHFKQNDLIILQNEISELPYIIEKAAEKEMCIVLNPSPFDETILACPLNKISYMFINEVEGEMLSKEKEPEKMLEVILTQYPDINVVLTLGSHGIWFANKSQKVFQDIYRVPVVDTTAAGDTFMGYYVASILIGKTEKEALDFAAYAAALAVSRAGAASSIPDFDEVFSKASTK